VSPSRPPTYHLLGALLLLTGLLVSGPQALRDALAQSDARDPREIALFDEDAGKAATLFADEDGADDRARWVHRRWERDRDNEDVRVGPIITDNRVWVARDVSSAQAIYQDQADKQIDFPEAADMHRGPFKFPKKIELAVDESTALSACVDCNGLTGINLHQRVVVRKGNVVSVIYIFGREKIATADLVLFFVGKLVERM